MKKIILVLAILFAAGLNSSQAQGTWTQKAYLGGSAQARESAVGFSIGSKGYIGTGVDFSFSHFFNDFWEYDPATDVWTQKADFAGQGRFAAVGFCIGSKGYIGTGGEPFSTNDFWEYDPSTNTWTQKANFGGGAREYAVGFSIGSKGYIGTGSDGSGIGINDFWEYDPATDTWTQEADFGGTGRYGAVGFSIGSKGYIGTGYTYPTSFNDFWEYDPSTNAWSQKANFGGSARSSAFGFFIGSKGYIGTGVGNGYYNDFWEYDPATDAWSKKADFGIRANAVGFSISNNGYMGTGFNGSVEKNDLWEYTLEGCAVPINLSVANITSSSVKLKWDVVVGAAGYKIRYRVSGTNQWTLKNSIGNAKNLNNLSPNTNYSWEVKTFCTIGPGVSSDWSAKQHFTTAPLRVGDESIQQVSFQIYPNPAEDHATIQFTLPQSSHVYIKVYDVSGKEITTLLNDDLLQGDHSLQINTNSFSKGVYVVRMISDFGIENQKLIVE